MGVLYEPKYYSDSEATFSDFIKRDRGAPRFTIVEDQRVCHRLGTSVAAIDCEAREIYMNPAAGFSCPSFSLECRFIMAHELLHAGLRHDVRCQGRDPYLWNVACDYGINGWLIEMGVGQAAQIGLLYDPAHCVILSVTFAA